MKTKITKLNIENKEVDDQLKKYFSKVNVFGNEPMILQKDENSDKVSISKPCTQEFFEKVFDYKGPFWDVYKSLGLSDLSKDIKYVKFVCGQMYFLKNIENDFIQDFDSEKKFIIKDGILFEENKTNSILNSINLSLNSFKRSKNKNKLKVIADDQIDKFEEFKEKADKYYNYYSDEKNIDKPIQIAKDSLELAVDSMIFSNLALLSYNLKINLKKSEAIEKCESDELEKLVISGDTEGIKKKFGFYSLAPYDVSYMRFSENPTQLEQYGSFACPINYAMRWRENAKFVAARYLEIQRRALKIIGTTSGLNELVFYFKISELEKLGLNDKSTIKAIISVGKNRKMIYEKYKNFILPIKIIFYNGIIYKIDNSVNDGNEKDLINSLSVSSKETIIAPVVNINSFEDYSKFTKGSIILSKNMSPNLAILIRKSKGLVSESGSALSHISIIAREACVPCFVQAKINREIKDGQYVELNGKTGNIRLIDKFFPVEKEIKENKIYVAKQLHDQISENREDISKDISKINISDDEKKEEIVWINKIDPKSDIYGSKATNLSILSKDYAVPNGFCVISNILEQINNLKNISELKSKLKESKKDIFALNEISKKLRENIINIELSKDLKDKLLINYEILNSRSLAVRSSSSFEDQKDVSFAGQFDTYLDINSFDQLIKAVKKCWASFYNTRSIVYRFENNINDDLIRMSVLVQDMIEAEYSGIIFTNNIDNSDTILLEVVPGMCENLALGKIASNSYVLSKENLFIFGRREEFDFDEILLRDISSIGLEIEEKLGKGKDIEWCVDKEGKIWILQVKPISAMKNKCSIER